MGTTKSGKELTDLEMMQSPDEWPRLTLPLKRKPWDVAVLTASLDNQTFYLLEDKSMFDEITKADIDLSPLGPLTADELQQVIDRGWVVD